MQAIKLSDLNDNVAIITGASSGIGRYCAIELSKLCNDIYIIGRNISGLEETNDEVIKNSCECTIVPIDLTKQGVIKELSNKIFEKHQRLDILISAAGIINNLSPVSSIKEEDAEKIFKTNYLANINLIQSFHPLLNLSKNGRVVVISSINKEINKPFWAGYSPIMSALNELVLTYAEENKNTNIKTNLVCPIAVDTEFRNTFMPGEDKAKIMTPSEFSLKFIELFKTKFNQNGMIYSI